MFLKTRISMKKKDLKKYNQIKQKMTQQINYFTIPIHFIHFGTYTETRGGSIITKKIYDCKIIDEYKQCNKTFFNNLQKYLEKYPSITTICYKRLSKGEYGIDNDIISLQKGNEVFYSKYTFIECGDFLEKLFTMELKRKVSISFDHYFSILQNKYSTNQCDQHIMKQLKNDSIKLSHQCHYQLNMKFIDIFQFIFRNEQIPLIDSYLLDGFDYINLFPSITLFNISFFSSDSYSSILNSPSNNSTSSQKIENQQYNEIKSNRIEISIQQIEYNHNKYQYELQNKYSFILPFTENEQTFDTILSNSFLKHFTYFFEKSKTLLFCCTSQTFQSLNSMKQLKLIKRSIDQQKTLILSDFDQLIKEFQRIHCINESFSECKEKISLYKQQITQHWYCEHHYFIPSDDCSFYQTSLHFDLINHLLSK